jgi:nitroimidazol reductase NimA-like FMN-containing flavoprotein (pyridoxamine 5'-phosphate oxidase superfamily)
MTCAVDPREPAELDRVECLRLLGQSTFGRIGITSGALPSVLPVNYRLVGERIIFRTGHGTKLDAATSNSIVAFEVDDVDPVSHAGWSVMVTGEARKVTSSEDLQDLDAAGVPHWVTSDVEATVEIATTLVSGRRIGQGLEG